MGCWVFPKRSQTCKGFYEWEENTWKRKTSLKLRINDLCINEKLWIGHFDITSKNGIPAYRHTVLSLSDNDIFRQKLEDIVDIGIYECEKYYPSFQQVLFEDITPKEALKFSNFEVIGRA